MIEKGEMQEKINFGLRIGWNQKVNYGDPQKSSPIELEDNEAKYMIIQSFYQSDKRKAENR